jgi:membrane protease subunit HflK
VQPPEQVLAAFDDAVKAGQDKDKLRNEGLAYANDVVPKAKGMAARLEQEAEAYQQKVVAQAEGMPPDSSKCCRNTTRLPRSCVTAFIWT